MEEPFQREKEISEIASKYVKIASEHNLTISEFLKSLKYAESKVMNGSYVSDSKLSSTSEIFQGKQQKGNDDEKQSINRHNGQF